MDSSIDLHTLQAEKEKCRLEKLGFSKAEALKRTGKSHLQPRWFAADPLRESIKIGEGIRWRYAGHYWAAKQSEFAGKDISELFYS